MGYKIGYKSVCGHMGIVMTESLLCLHKHVSLTN